MPPLNRHSSAESTTGAFSLTAGEDEEKIHFAEAAAHDLREPLRMVAGFCGLVLRDYGEQLDDRGRDYLARAVSATGRMNALLESLAQVAQLGAQGAASRWFAARESLDEALENLDALVRETGARVTSDDLPTLFGDAPRFASLLQNLIGNALKHAPRGRAPHVHVSAVREGRFWRFSVSDNGDGVAGADHARIFEPFVRLGHASGQPGAGLGLPICRRIVADFGGRIWVVSPPGGGATFNLTVMLREADAETPRRLIAVGGRPAQLLLVEDDDGDVILTREAFKAAGLVNDVMVAHDGLDALRLLRESETAGRRPDLVLLDLNLPRMSGREVVAAIRQDPELRNVAVIAFAAAGADDPAARGLAVDGALAKPIDVEQLGALVNRLGGFRFARAEPAATTGDGGVDAR